jgi:hypothetical protein
MAWYSDTDSSKKFPLGFTRQDVNGNEYIYMKGVASLAIGSWVTFDENFAPTLLAADAVGPVAISMAANTAATTYSWFQRKGVNTVAKTDTVAADVQLYIDGTAGRADDAVVTGDLILGASSQTADTSNVATVRIDYPSVTNVLG